MEETEEEGRKDGDKGEIKERETGRGEKKQGMSKEHRREKELKDGRRKG